MAKEAKFCPGCGYPVVLRFLHTILKDKKLDKKTALGLDIGCSLLAWDALPINTFQTHHGRVVPTMVGLNRAKPELLSIALVGDGGAYAIGLQSLLWAAMRNDPILVIVANNTVYAMTGGQMAPTTMIEQKTDTSPAGSDQPPVLGPELIRGLSPKAYLARAAVNDVKQLNEYLNKAIEACQLGNFALVEVLSFCPTNWRTKGAETNERVEEMKRVFKIGEF
ncbi:MAG: 2-oxoglutarate synthase [Candidatus Magasanikbacteria bacterium]|nr:2-oxoglutarate synthase [Candidatus Magasanikbacteria bacterium]